MLETPHLPHIKHRRRGPGRVILVVAWGLLYLASTHLACTPGRVDLLTGGSGGETSLGTGGRAPTIEGSGGRDGTDIIDNSSGAAAGYGGQDDHYGPPDKPKDPKPYDPDDETIPCFFRGKCLPLCEDHAQLCEACEHSAGCEWPFPHCDVAQQSCVECLTGNDCVERFGDEFPACSAGKCVQCQHEGDCASGEFCVFGMCAECRKSFDCDLGEACVDLRCVLFEEPPPGSGGMTLQGSGGQSGDKDSD